MTYSQADKGTVDTEGPGHWGPTILYNMCWISSFYKAVWKHIRGLCTSRAPPRKFRTCLCNLKLHGFTKEKLSWQRLVTYPNCHFLSFLLQNKPWVSIVQQCASSPSGINCSAMRYNAKLCKALESLILWGPQLSFLPGDLNAEMIPGAQVAILGYKATHKGNRSPGSWMV